jgi:hypothetical protein
MRGESSTVTVSVADENSCLITETDKEYYAARKVVHEYGRKRICLGKSRTFSAKIKCRNGAKRT